MDRKDVQEPWRSHYVAEPSDYYKEKPARRQYEKRGYQIGMDVKDFFGPGRDLITYFTDISKEKIEALIAQEKISQENKAEILELGKRIFSPERQKELEVCLDLLLGQPEDEETVDKGRGIILRDSENKVTGFAILTYGVYGNAIFVDWEGVNPDNPKGKKQLIDAIKGIAKVEDKDVIVVTREGEDNRFLEEGFQSGKNGIGPNFYERGDESIYLMYTKRL